MQNVNVANMPIGKDRIVDSYASPKYKLVNGSDSREPVRRTIMSEASKDQPGNHDVAVAIITPSGIYPSEDTLARVPRDTPVAEVLQRAAAYLKLTNTGDWVLRHGERTLAPHDTFKHLGLTCIVDLEWHKAEGGGGA